MSQLDIDAIVTLLEEGRLLEVTQDRLELKSDWHQDYGKDISAIANHPDFKGGWLIIGVNDQGKVIGKDVQWLKRTEEQASNHINCYLVPCWAVANVSGKILPTGAVLFIQIKNPDDVVEWNNKAYKLTGTLSQIMTPDEQLELSLKLPGQDYTKTEDKGSINGALVMEYAAKLQEADPTEFAVDLASIAPTEILKKLSLFEKTTAAILFGKYTFRVIRYDQNGDILDQEPKAGIYHVVSDDFLNQIQAWTRRQGTILRGNTASVTEEMPYPVKALREVLANAVAHALYHRGQGNIVIELRPDRITVSNTCSPEAKLFTKKWFSRETHAKNKLLMKTLRIAKITDEAGTGKSRVFRMMIEAGKREPIVEFLPTGNTATWSFTLYNDEQNQPLLALIEHFKELFPAPDKYRIATALVLWKDYSWTEIQERLDEHFKRIALEVVHSDSSPVFIIRDKLFVRRWVTVRLTGQTSKRFTQAEEEQILVFLRNHAFSANRNGNISTEEARRIVGLSNAPSEVTQLSNLFRKWSDNHLIELVKRGHWRFLTETETDDDVLMSGFNSRSESGT